MIPAPNHRLTDGLIAALVCIVASSLIGGGVALALYSPLNGWQAWLSATAIAVALILPGRG